jgi:SAM-dependent methyltransferase
MAENGWRTSEAAEHYRNIANLLVPRRSEVLDLIAELATTWTPKRPRVLDLGCGYGDVTDAVLERSADAAVCMVDFSDEMIRLSTDRFGTDPAVRVMQHDLNAGLPASLATEQFDAVVSCFALHHVEPENRIKLYCDVHAVLAEGGLFINGDRFTSESESLAEWEFDTWVRFMERQIREKLGREKTFAEIKQGQIESDERMGDAPGSLWAMERDLRESGFRGVDCVWKLHILGIVVATK